MLAPLSCSFLLSRRKISDSPVPLAPDPVLIPEDLADPLDTSTPCAVVDSVSLTTTTEVEAGTVGVVELTMGVSMLEVGGLTIAAEVVRMAAEVVGGRSAAEVVGTMGAADVVGSTAEVAGRREAYA